MDWLERLCGWAPDGGDGSLELLIGLALGCGVLAVAAIIARARDETHS